MKDRFKDIMISMYEPKNFQKHDEWQVSENVFISAGCQLNQLILEEEVPNAAHEPPVEVGFSSCWDDPP